MNISMSTASPIVTTATQRNGSTSTSVLSSSTQIGSSSILRNKKAGYILRSSLLQQQTVASSLPAMTTATGTVLVPQSPAGVREMLPASFAVLHQPSPTHTVNLVGERQHPASFVIGPRSSNGAGHDVLAYSSFASYPTQHAGYDPAYSSAAYHASDTRFASHPMQHAGYDPAFPSAALHTRNVLASSTAVSQQHIPSDPPRLHTAVQHAGYDPAYHPAAHLASNVPPSSAVPQQHIPSDLQRLHQAVQHAGYDPAHPSAAQHARSIPASSAVHHQHLPSTLYGYGSHSVNQTGHDSLWVADQTGILPATIAPPHHRESSTPSSHHWMRQAEHDPGFSSAASLNGYDSRFYPTSPLENVVFAPASSSVTLRNWAHHQAQQAGFYPAIPSATPLDRYEVTSLAVAHQFHDPASFSPHSAQHFGSASGFSSATLRAGYDPVLFADRHQPFLPAFDGSQLMDQSERYQDPFAASHHSGYDPPFQSANEHLASQRFNVQHVSTSVLTGLATAPVSTEISPVFAHVAGFALSPALDSASHQPSADNSSIVDSTYSDSLQRSAVNMTSNGAGRIPALSSMLQTLSVKSEHAPLHPSSSSVSPNQGLALTPATTRSHLANTVYCLSGASICSSIAESRPTSSASVGHHANINYGPQQHHPTAAPHFDPFAAAAARVLKRSSAAKASSSFGSVQQQSSNLNSSVTQRQDGFNPPSFATDPSAQTCASSQHQSVLPSSSSTGLRNGFHSNPHHLNSLGSSSVLLPPRFFDPSNLDIKVESFDGNPLNFSMFIGSFKALIHDQLPNDALRLAALKQHLVKEVRDTIADSLQDPSQYNFAISRLYEEYGLDLVVSEAHIDKLLTLPNIQPNDSQSIKTFSNELHAAVSALICSGHHREIDSTGTLKLILQKLPDSLRSKWGTKVLDMHPRIPNIVGLNHWLRKMTKVNQLASGSIIGSYTNPPSSSSHHRPFDPRSASSTPSL